MRLPALASAVVAVLAATALVSNAAPAPTAARIGLVGKWMGGYSLGGARTHVRIAFSRAGRLLVADAMSPTGAALPVTRVAWSRSRVSFRIGRIRFAGRLSANRIDGGVASGRRRGRFTLLRLVSPRRGALAAAVGVYRLQSGRLLAVYESSPDHGIGFGAARAGGLRIVDLSSGEVRGLFPLARGGFAAGPALNVGFPVQFQARFEPGAMWWRDGRAAEQRGARLHFRRETVTFASAGARLTGWLHVPPSPGPHPAVVIVHGSGPAVRSQDYLQHVVNLFAAHGLAVLVYDKRGSGESTGTPPGDEPVEATFRILSDDVLAGVAYLRSRPEIDRARVGLWGLSQGGWVGSYAASRSRDVAFAILVSGGAASAAEEAVWSDLTGDGARVRSEADPAVASALTAAGAGGWDPEPVLRQIAAPVLFLHGENDLSLPPLTSVRRIERLRAEGKTFTSILLPRADHELYETPRGLTREVPLATRFAPGYFASMLQWLREHGFAPA